MKVDGTLPAFGFSHFIHLPKHRALCHLLVPWCSIYIYVIIHIYIYIYIYYVCVYVCVCVCVRAVGCVLPFGWRHLAQPSRSAWPPPWRWGLGSRKNACLRSQHGCGKLGQTGLVARSKATQGLWERGRGGGGTGCGGTGCCHVQGD